MSNSKQMAIILGTAVGVGVVAAAVGVYVARHREPVANVNDILEQARNNIRSLDKAVQSLRQSASRV